MKLSLAIALTLSTVVDGSSWNNLRRRLSYEKVAGYNPGSQVCNCSVVLCNYILIRYCYVYRRFTLQYMLIYVL